MPIHLIRQYFLRVEGLHPFLVDEFLTGIFLMTCYLNTSCGHVVTVYILTFSANCPNAEKGKKKTRQITVT